MHPMAGTQGLLLKWEREPQAVQLIDGGPPTQKPEKTPEAFPSCVVPKHQERMDDSYS